MYYYCCYLLLKFQLFYVCCRKNALKKIKRFKYCPE
ncbi:hypothetical protein F383_19611 [Gossypium arboreum]|uniref:Uncharacterized protein n=1 Tax=Gossypium arboreum TaxID=29729 RepID=A0A0B0NIJ3_GOSAR|nr:hypothetical protein F383_19611 [Gossypium arboreum]